MKTLKLTSVAQVFVAAFIALTAGAAFAAAPTTWSLAANCVGSSPSGTNLGATTSCTADSAGINLGGYSTTTAGAKFAAASIYTYGSDGLGIVASGEGTGEGPHAIDNIGFTDAMLIRFEAATSLTSVTIGWDGTDNPTGTGSNTHNDSDLTVLAWAGPGTPGAVTGLTTGGLLSAGWKVIGNYGNVGSLGGANDTVNITTTETSSYWLVSAYDKAAFGGSLDATKNDAFKLVSLAGTTTHKTPEPGSLALLGIGLLGWVASRKRKAVSA